MLVWIICSHHGWVYDLIYDIGYTILYNFLYLLHTNPIIVFRFDTITLFAILSETNYEMFVLFQFLKKETLSTEKTLLEEFNKLFKTSNKNCYCLNWNLFSLMFSFIKKKFEFPLFVEIFAILGTLLNIKSSLSLQIQIHFNLLFPCNHFSIKSWNANTEQFFAYLKFFAMSFLIILMTILKHISERHLFSDE